jgi:RHS repeat-associated protein
MHDVEYRYDTVAHGLGKPASVSNGLVTTRYTEYSAVGELLQSQQEFDGVAAPYTFHYAYNMAGQMVSETYPSGRVVMNTFDAEGKNDSISSRGAGHAPHIFANGFHYNDKGVMDRLRLGNGLWEGSSVNSRYQPTQITLGTSAGGSELLKLDYNYGSGGNNGNVLSQTITVPTIGTATGFVTTQAYTYDSLNRLATVEEKQYDQSTADWRQQFGYDRYGNRAMGTGSTQTFGRNSTETQSLIGPDPTVSTSTNRITNKTGEHYEFDASGNMTKDALGNRSVYDIENHQTEYYYAANTGENPDAKYYYDGDGRRIKKVVGTETTVFVYDAGGKLAAEYTQGVTANPSPQTNYITTDTLGSPRIVTNGAGQVVARHDYLPFGEEIHGLGGRNSAQGFAQPDTTRHRFTGYEHDAETGLDFAQARYYGNGLGRFTGVDPLLESAKTPVPQSWNRYSYCANNPIKYVDPTGLRYWWKKSDTGDHGSPFWVDGDGSPGDEYEVAEDIYYGGDEFGWVVLDEDRKFWQSGFDTREEAGSFFQELYFQEKTLKNPPQDISVFNSLMMPETTLLMPIGGGLKIEAEGCELVSEEIGAAIIREGAAAGIEAVAKKIPQIILNRIAGKAAEALFEKELVAQGVEVVGTNIAMRTSAGLRYVDILAKTPAGDFLAYEVKSGAGVRTAAQLAKDELMATEGAVIVSSKLPRYVGQNHVIQTVVITK